MHTCDYDSRKRCEQKGHLYYLRAKEYIHEPQWRSLVRANVCPSTSKRFVNLGGQLVLHHTRENHQILGHDQQLVRKALVHLRLIRAARLPASLIPNARDAPHDDMSNVARNDLGQR